MFQVVRECGFEHFRQLATFIDSMLQDEQEVVAKEPMLVIKGAELSTLIWVRLRRRQVNLKRLLSGDPLQLAERTGLPVEVFDRIHHVAHRRSLIPPTAWERPAMQITSGLASVDGMFDEAVWPETLIEIYGPPAVGKTQLCMYMAMNVLKFQSGSRVSWIDVGLAGFEPTRFQSFMSSSAIDDRLSFWRVFDVFSLHHILYQLLHSNTHHDLVVIDGITSALIPIAGDRKKKNQQLFQQIQTQLESLPATLRCPIVITNNAIRYMDSDTNDNRTPNGVFRPAMGRAWASIPQVRLFCSRLTDDDRIRVLTVERSSFQVRQRQARFIISETNLHDAN